MRPDYFPPYHPDAQRGSIIPRTRPRKPRSLWWRLRDSLVLWALSGVGRVLDLMKVPAERYRGRVVFFADQGDRLVPRVPQRPGHLHAQPAVGRVDPGRGGCPDPGVRPDDPQRRIASRKVSPQHRGGIVYTHSANCVLSGSRLEVRPSHDATFAYTPPTIHWQNLGRPGGGGPLRKHGHRVLYSISRRRRLARTRPQGIRRWRSRRDTSPVSALATRPRRFRSCPNPTPGRS